MNIVFYTHRSSFLFNWVIPLSKYLNSHIYVFNISSLNNENINHTHYDLNNIDIIDISNYSIKGIIELIHQIKPNLYISLGFRSPFELLLMRIHSKLKIKTLLLEHGLFTEDTIQLNFLKNIFFVIRFTLRKNIVFFLRIIEYLGNSQNPIKELLLFINAIIFGKYVNIKFNKAYFFGEFGLDKLNEYSNYTQNEIVLCGYPLFDSTKIESENKNIKVCKNKEVLYVHQPFIKDKIVKITYNEEFLFINEIANLFENKGYKFTMLLHPREDIQSYKILHSKSNINIIRSPNNYSVFTNKEIVLGHYSTALLYPIYFNINTIIINYPSLIKNLAPFKEMGQYIEDINELSKVLNKDSFVSPNKKMLYHIIGANNSFENIGNLINREQ